MRAASHLFSGWRLERKLRKLRRDPEAFVADSKLYKLMSSKGLVPTDLVPRWLRANAATEVDSHPLFDAAWYLAQLPEPLAGDESPLAHYLRVGASQGLTPHPLFDVRWYVSQLPQPLCHGESPLEHYLRVGASQGLSPHPLFDVTSYRRPATQDTEPEA